jgi:uncharacterized radical SAM superfamily Fe-S cluster-containing enzyme
MKKFIINDLQEMKITEQNIERKKIAGIIADDRIVKFNEINKIADQISTLYC